MKQKEKQVSSKISDLSYDAIRTEIFEETYFFYVIVSIIENSFKICCIMMWIQFELNFLKVLTSQHDKWNNSGTENISN